MKYNRGFTVVELVVVIAIISILAGVVIFNAVAGSTRSRDIDRQADLRTMQSAIELYKQRYGRYPAQCARANPGAAGAWSGQSGTNYACVDGQQYIVGLAPEFMPTLPRDGKLNGTDSGYVYTVNNDGTVYKLAARRTVEIDTTLSYTHPFKYCDADGTSNNTSLGNTAMTKAPICNTVYSLPGTAGGGAPAQCQDGDSVFETSYAVWGGYANAPNIGGSNSLADYTEDIICL